MGCVYFCTEKVLASKKKMHLLYLYSIQELLLMGEIDDSIIASNRTKQLEFRNLSYMQLNARAGDSLF